MPFIVVKSAFKFAHFGYQVEEFSPSPKAIETTEECAALAIQEGWAKAGKAPSTDAAEASAEA
jgi:hypothetical protein